ncbi:MAG: 4-hydroxy-tetrahydrodipicolinate synthase [Candidatus Dadabacteria bacterium]|nr:4-hydroxy-tetrahydrodipicolinate synthase [Candidatus Dadabacteria bacterium]NIQ13904.1 4-hydroxy-tetrahydrodipicolinate synthase [Candidatus Dadabacteria bacterium]
MIHGSIVAIVTPFLNGEVDFEKLGELIEFQIENGTHGIVPVGTTGESPTLSHKEHKEVIKFTVEAVNKRIPVVAGTGSNSTTEAVKLTEFSKNVGADAALIVVPYYNKPTQSGLYKHFNQIANEVDIPIILYNVPGRTVVNMLPETVARLANDCKNIIGIKEASGSLEQATEILNLCGKDFILLSGDDALNYPLLSIGGKGFITVTANIAPGDVAQMYNSFSMNNIEEAKSIHYKLLPLNEVLFLESNPIPVKAALNLMGFISSEIRAPLYPLSEDNISKLKTALNEYGLI